MIPRLATLCNYQFLGERNVAELLRVAGVDKTLKKISQPHELGNDLSCHDSLHQGWLSLRMYLVEVTRSGRLCREFTKALIQRAIEHQIRTRCLRAALVIQ